MSKVFTITQGLENMGALKTGGQGSVYKGRRIGEIISAIKILPTPLYSESNDDKNFVAFQNEVNKLKRVNAEPNANVVSILSSGVTDSGNFPYIEMEYIEGPDLSELLKEPHPPVFAIDEILKVASHISNALSHCHKANVKHGDIKSNNVKFNKHTGNYILLDFGLSLLSDEERRTSMRHAGAIEFMAPEQNNGALLFQTDVYSFGVILYELIGGAVPFPLKDGGETSRNEVMVAHMETPVPDVVALRNLSMPETWTADKRSFEKNVPHWLLNTVYKCLEKDPSRRFKNGMELHEHIMRSQIVTSDKHEFSVDEIRHIREENERLKREKRQLQTIINNRPAISYNSNGHSKTAPVAKPPFFSLKNSTLMLLTLSTLGLLAYILYNNNKPVIRNNVATVVTDTASNQQLRMARMHLNNGNTAAAMAIYKNLIPFDQPEALYQAANLALKDQNKEIDCLTAITYLEKSATTYAPAKRTLGFLYTSDAKALEVDGYQRCPISRNIAKGSSYLMEAMLLGDATAGKLLDELNAKLRDRAMNNR